MQTPPMPIQFRVQIVSIKDRNKRKKTGFTNRTQIEISQHIALKANKLVKSPEMIFTYDF